ncbi:Protein CLP1-like protein [Smittium mucronatum]|uniref:Polynucleotide 5'-hydroxyl-kinase GRC3 n=1 Tax=Smittium mucronatum TaxID=133383 RepID=A0A1R0GMN0_9FUNG|nr:Protein CLP1-like protein [Smittium mucronatum]
MLVLGPKDSGKTTIVRTLANYAIRQQETPIIINLDPSEGMTVVPGTISATTFSKPLNAQDGFLSYSLLESNGIIDYPLVYHYGYLSPSDQPSLYKKVVKSLADSIEKQLSLSPKYSKSGFIIDTSDQIDHSNYQLLQDIIADFKVDRILVVDNERLFSDFNKMYSQNQSVSVAKVPKSGGVSNNIIYSSIISFFFSQFNFLLFPIHTPLPPFYLMNLSPLFFITKESLAPSSTLPIGQVRQVSETQITKVEVDEKLSHMLIAVLQLDSQKPSVLPPQQQKEEEKEEEAVESLQIDESSIINSPVLGYINITLVDMKASHLVVLSPAPGRIPEKVLLAGEIQWIDS